MDCSDNDLFEALFHPWRSAGELCAKGSPSAQTAGLDCEPCHMPMAWTFLILDVQSFQMHRLVCSPGSIRC
jgi:hypothetical protein